MDKFTSLLRRKLGIDRESIKKDLKMELKEELFDEFSEKIQRKDSYISTLIDSMEGKKEIEESRKKLRRETPSDLSRLKRELDILERRLKNRAHPRS